MRPQLTEDEVAQARAEVCRVAQVLFARHGVQGVTMRQIAGELGWSPTTAYRYFRSREEILAAVRAGAFNRFCEVIETATRSGRDAHDSARNVGEAYIAFALRHPDAYRMMFDINDGDVPGNAELEQALARSLRCMVAYVTPLIEDGTLVGEPHALGQMLWATAHGLVMLRLAGIVSSDAELRRLHEITMSALVRGLHRAAANGAASPKSTPARPRARTRQTTRSPPRKS